MKCLWIARDLPFPLDAGDRIYSAHLAEALAESGAAVRFFGFAGGSHEPPATTRVEWLPVTGGKRGQTAAALSMLPLAAALHDTAEYRKLLDAQYQKRWDAIVFDSYGSGWAFKHYLSVRRANGGTRPVLVHVSHNQEGALWNDMVRHSQSGHLRRLALWQNWLKVRALERFLLRRTDLNTAINDEDATAFEQIVGKRPLVLTPGYSGKRLAARVIDPECPRRVVLLGSFRWVVKQENLRQFIALADASFHRHGIMLDVIGDVPEPLLAELRSGVKATVFHGFVDDVMPYFARARLAVVPEAIGGGFKLKFLDYIFARLPVATIASAAAGLPPAIRSSILSCARLDTLVATLIAHIDQLDALNDMQNQAFSAAVRLFDWHDRGARLRDAIADRQRLLTGVPHSRHDRSYEVNPS